MTEEEKNDLIRKLSREAEGFLTCGDVDSYYKVVAELSRLQQPGKKEGQIQSLRKGE